MTRSLAHVMLLPAAVAFVASALHAQEDPKKQPIPLGTPEGQAAREQMWRPPTAEEWQKPVLLKFQRTFDDAVAVSKETGRPILVCVNMDGEIASEHYAGVRYRSPEIAKIYEPYVCVIASVYRHNPRDYDENGKRIICPRFGSVTCGEHIWIEPLLFGKYFESQRVAPRHIMVELDGAETYDVYYAFDTRSVFDTIQKGILQRRKEMTQQLRQRPERSLLDRITSRDAEDRDAVEAAYREGDRALKQKLLQRAVANAEAEQLDMLRLAIYDLDVELNRLARQALMKAADSEDAVELINQALRVQMETQERQELIATLERLGERFPRAKKLAVVHKGLASTSKSVDVKDWSRALANAKIPQKVEWSALESKLEYKSAASRERPKDAGARLELAEASLALAIDPKTTKILAASRKSGSKYARLMLLDAQRSAKQAEQLGAKGWRVQSVLAIAAYYLGESKEAFAHAEQAVADLPKGDQSWNAMGVLGIFAEARMAAIRRAERAKREWPGQWLTDVHAAYAVLSQHPLGTDTQVVTHYDFLLALAAEGQANRTLDAGLQRFPDSGLLHDRLRGRILKAAGVDGLERAYDAMLAKDDAPANLRWFAGYASIVAAEFHRRAGTNDAAIAAYGRAIAHFDRAIENNPASRHSADHFASLAMAGRARLAYEREDFDTAVTQLLASFQRKPESGGSLDGLNQSPMATAKLLQRKLEEAQQSQLLAKLTTAIDALPPQAFEEPEFERNTGTLPSQVWRNGKMRRPGWRDRSDARERQALEEAQRQQEARLRREREAKRK